MLTRLVRINLLFSFAVFALAVNGCAPHTVIVGGSNALAPKPFCSAGFTYSGGITVTGTAYYAYRVNGNQEVADGGIKLTPTLPNTSFSVTIGAGTPYTITTALTATSSQVTSALANLINANSAETVVAKAIPINGAYHLILNLKNYDEPPWATSVSANNLTQSYRTNARPIRFAEVEARDSSGALIQCASTNNSGAYSLSLPAGTGSYTIKVNSRIINSTKANVYVLNDPFNNLHHSISKTVPANVSSPGVNILAPGDGTLEGGAFNILDQFVKANEFLMTHLTAANGCGTTFSDCQPMTQAPPLLYAYWTAGASPSQWYENVGNISFYIGGERILHILGGENGNVDNADTDHFDNSVIVHEYGHFIEDVYSVSESLGGSHNLGELIDPRLAWSEGFADFFQAAVTGTAAYIDTSGNSTGTDSELINESLEVGTYTDGRAAGIFDEFAITRFLWDAFDSASDGMDSVGGLASTFSEMWAAFAGTVTGMSSPSHKFRHVGTFLKIQDAHPSKTDWSSIRGMQSLNTNSAYSGVGYREFATPIAFGSMPCNSSISMPFSFSGDEDDYHYQQDYFRYDHPGGAANIRLTYSTSTSTNLNLRIYSDSQYLWSSGSAFSTSSTIGQTEQISSSLAAGKYLIAIQRVSGGAATYSLYINNTIVCPQFD